MSYVNHSWSSLWSVETSSTEHFFAATLATLSSRRRASARVLELPCSMIGKRSLDIMSSTNSVSILYARRRGVFHALVEKSMRIKRTPSLVKGSRQKGQTGVSREDVLLTMLLQQFKHSK